MARPDAPIEKIDTMTRAAKLLAMTAGTAIIGLNTAPAVAEGTSAGTTISNTATVDYRVGGVDQIEETASDSFVVDRKVTFVINRVLDPVTTVAPGQTNTVITFDVTNLSNDTIDLALAAAQLTGDDFDADNVRIFIGAANAIFDGSQTQSGLIDELPEDETRRVFLVSDIPLGRANGDIANLTLAATAYAGGASGQGALLTNTAGANTAGLETVLAEAADAEGGSANDGVFTARGTYEVFAATLSVAKTSRVVEDPVNGTTNPKAIPGAVIEYCIAVSNAAGSAAATNVVVTDVLPDDLTFVAGSIRVDGTLDGSGLCAGGNAAGSITGRTITAPLSDVAASDTRTAAFRATIN